MKRLVCILILFIFALPAYALDSALRNHAFNAPHHLNSSTHSLTSYLIKPCKDDYERLYVIAYWIASHISYDEYKYNNGKINDKAMAYKGDILKEQAGICQDFAQLFADMANIAGVRNVKVVHGYVLENQVTIKKFYRQKDMPKTGHAWNSAEIKGRKFYIDTTFMSGNRITPTHNHANNLKHKLDLNKNGRSKEVYTDVNDTFFDFTPKEEIKKVRMIHLQQKFIK